jgi:hypothetical protein
MVVGIEGAWRAWRARPPGRLADRLDGLLLLAVVVTSAGGLGLVVGGGRPSDALHFIYGLVALGIVPTAAYLSRQASARQRGMATTFGTLVALAVIVRLFQTG